MKTVYIEDGSYAYAALFKRLGFAITKVLEEASLVCFTGGADVSPDMYGDKQHPFTQNDEWRDAKEERLFHATKDLNIPMVGICRGGQFLNVMSGGRMYQHVQAHTRSHLITDARTGETVYVSSTHHQMIMPSPKAVIVATAALGGEREWYDGDVFKKDVSKEDIEVVYYPDTKALCFQPHPEFSSPEYDGMVTYFDKLLKEFT
jgi:GMP synthase-like glutamine amidotransferase